MGLGPQGPTRRGMKMTDLDRDVEFVAREMTAGEPSSAVRARVLARLDQRPSHSWAGIGRVALVAGGAIVLLIVFTHRQAPVTPAATDSHLRQTQLAPMASKNPGDEAPPPAHKGTCVDVRRADLSGPACAPGLKARPTYQVAVQQTSELTEAAVAWDARAVPALDQPAALTVESIQPEPLEIRPLVTTALTVPALGDDEGGR